MSRGLVMLGLLLGLLLVPSSLGSLGRICRVGMDGRLLLLLRLLRIRSSRLGVSRVSWRSRLTPTLSGFGRVGRIRMPCRRLLLLVLLLRLLRLLQLLRLLRLLRLLLLLLLVCRSRLGMP